MFVAVEEQLSITYSEFVFVDWHPACNTHAPCFHLWHAWLDNIFLHYLINGKIFGGKKLLNIKHVSDVHYNFCLKHFSF
jgi:hypothetical protein